jgi:hypothetical protein
MAEQKISKLQQSEDLKKLLRKAEIKRVGENLSKKELCDIFGFNYNFYMNCISNRNLPSAGMADALRYYLEIPTSTVYEMVFAHRSSNDFKGKTVKRRENGKEEFHELLGIEDDDYKEFISQLEKNGIFKEPTAKFEQE